MAFKNPNDNDIGGCYISTGGGVTSITNNGTFYQLVGTFTSTSLGSFTHSGGAITYTGSASRVFIARACLTFYTDSFDTFRFRFAINGTTVAGSEQQITIPETFEGNSRQVNLLWPLQLSTNNIVTVYLTSVGEGNESLTIQNGTISIGG
jgi:hypothetical protein